MAGRLTFNLVLIGLAIYFLVQAYHLPVSRVAEHGVTPSFFPKAVLWIFLAAMVWITARDLHNALKAAGTAAPEEPAGALPSVRLRGLACLGAVFVQVVAYVLVIERLGYLISTGIFLLATSLTLLWFLPSERRAAKQQPIHRRLLPAAVFAVTASGAIYVIFTQLFNIVLP